MFEDLKIEQYQTIEDARLAIPNASHFDSFKIAYNDNANKTEGRILTGIIVCKSFKTIENNFLDFLKYYKIDFVTKVFWENTTWEISYKPSEYKYTVKSGTQMGTYGDEFSTRHNTNPWISRNMESQVRSLLREARNNWPSARFAELYERIKKIGLSSSYGR